MPLPSRKARGEWQRTHSSVCPGSSASATATPAQNTGSRALLAISEPCHVRTGAYGGWSAWSSGFGYMWQKLHDSAENSGLTSSPGWVGAAKAPAGASANRVVRPSRFAFIDAGASTRSATGRPARSTPPACRRWPRTRTRLHRRRRPALRRSCRHRRTNRPGSSW